jgi:5'-3' exonuclease
MDITILQYAIIDNFNKYCGIVEPTKINHYINDYVFLGMILGNDFMPKNHWYSIYENGIEKILSSYFQIYNHGEKFLVDSNSLQINTEMLCDIWFLIKEKEQTSILKLFETRKSRTII